MLNGIFASFQFGALYFVVDALASDNHSFTSVWLSLGMMALSITGRIFASFFSMNEQTVVGYGMVADKRISIGDRLRYIPMGYFNKNNIVLSPVLLPLRWEMWKVQLLLHLLI